MLELSTTDEFERDLERLRREGKDLDHLWDVIDILLHEIELPADYNDHKLHGEWAGSRDFHLESNWEGDWIVVYRIEDGKLKLERTGTHQDLFRSWRGR